MLVGMHLLYRKDLFSRVCAKKKMDSDSVKLASKNLEFPKKKFKKLEQKMGNKKILFVPLVKLKEYSSDLLDVKGIIISTETGRIYPLGESAAHLVGYLQNGEGKSRT